MPVKPEVNIPPSGEPLVLWLKEEKIHHPDFPVLAGGAFRRLCSTFSYHHIGPDIYMKGQTRLWLHMDI